MSDKDLAKLSRQEKLLSTKHRLNASEVFNSNLKESKDQANLTVHSQNERHIGGELVKYNGIFNNNFNLKIPDLADSNKLPTSNADQLLAHVQNNQYNCHEYIMYNIDSKHVPGLLRKILSFGNIPLGNLFPSGATLNNFGYIEVTAKDLIIPGENNIDKKVRRTMPITQIENLNLKPGDIVCCIDKSKPVSFQEVHSAVVLGKDGNTQIILGQKLNEQDPVVDMTASYFDQFELGKNKTFKIYRKEK